MKKQIRAGVFETNSSTQHALVIKSQYRERKLEEGVPEGYQLPENVLLKVMSDNELDDMPLTTFENRLLYLYNAMYSWEVYKDTLVRFIAYLNKLGINYELCDDDMGTPPEPMAGDIVRDIMDKAHTERFMAFLFADDIFYDSFADDEVYDISEYDEWDDKIAAFINGEEVIYLNERC